MGPTEKSIEERLADLREAVEGALDIGYSSDSCTGTLAVISRLTPDSLSMARNAHIEMVARLAEIVSGCGYVEPTIAEIVNGLRDLVREIDPSWYFEDGQWGYSPQCGERARQRKAIASQRLAEVAQ